MRSIAERMAEKAGVSIAEAVQHQEAFRHVVDRMVADGVTVVAPPLIAGWASPTWQRLRYLVKRADWVAPPDFCDADERDLARALRLPLEEMQRYPLVGEIGILVEALDLLGIADSGSEKSGAMLDVWLEQFASPAGIPKPYQVTPVGREKLFEEWLLADLGRLSSFGYDVRLAVSERDGFRGREHRFFDARRSDLILRATRDCERMRAGDWLVVENKATAVGSPACEQLSMYVDWLRHDLGGSDQVHGLLIADGTSVNLGRALRERGLDYLSLTSLGYRDHLWRSEIDRVRDADPTSIELPTLQGLD